MYEEPLISALAVSLVGVWVQITELQINKLKANKKPPLEGWKTKQKQAPVWRRNVSIYRQIWIN